MRAICSRCGTKTHLIEGMCEDCFKATYNLITVKNREVANYCPRCGSHKFKRWFISEDPVEDLVNEIVSKSVKPSELAGRNRKITLKKQAPGEILIKTNIKSVDYDKKAIIVDISAEGRIDPEKTHTSHEIHRLDIQLEPQLCQTCSKIAGGSYAAILQVRGLKNQDKFLREVEDTVRNLMKTNFERGFRDSYIAKEEYTKNGIDFYLGSQSAAKQLRTNLGTKFPTETKESYKLVGRSKDGRPLQRLTVSIRFLDLWPGTIIELNNKPYLIRSHERGKSTLYDIIEDSETSIPTQIVTSSRSLGKLNELRELTVLATWGDTVSLLNHENNTEIQIDGANVKPEPGSKAFILDYNTRKFLIPGKPIL